MRLESQSSRWLREYVRNGSDSAFRKLVEQYGSLVYSVCLRKLGRPDLAEDAAQTTFILLARKAAGFKPGIVLSAWLYRTAWHAASWLQREERRRASRERESAGGQRMTEEARTERHERLWQQTKRVLDDALSGLSARHRDVIALRFFEERSFREIGVALGCSEDAARMKTNRALGRLRKVLDAQSILLSVPVLAGFLTSRISEVALPASLAKTILSGTVGSIPGATGGIVAAAKTEAMTQGVSKMLWWAKWKTATIAAAVMLPAMGVSMGAAQALSAPASQMARPSVDDGDTKDAVSPKKEEGPRRVVWRGEAVSLDGVRVPGIKVTLFGGEHGKREELGSATTDATGKFELSVPEHKDVRYPRLRVDAPADGKLVPCDFVTRGENRLIESRQVVGWLKVFLAKGTAGVSGTVKNDQGKPLSGATVKLVVTGGNRTWHERVAKTDEQGRYRLGNLAPATYKVKAVDPPQGSPWVRLANWKPHGVRWVKLGSGMRSVEDFDLPRGAILKGRVLDESGKPVVGAPVSCSHDEATEIGKSSMYQSPGQWFSAEATTDANGMYVLAGLTQETYRIRVESPGKRALASAVLRGINAPTGSEVSVQDVTLHNAGVLSGVVVGKDSKPIAEARAKLVMPRLNPFARDEGPVSVSDKHGRFVFKDLPAGAYAVDITPPTGSSWCPARIERVPVVSGLTVNHRLTLIEGATVSGVVTDPRGKPVAGASVIVRYGVPTGRKYTSHEFPVSKEGMTGADGRFEVSGLSAPPPGKKGTWQVFVRPPETVLGAVGTTVSLARLPTGGSATALVRLKVGAAITGVVTGPGGKPVPGCHVAAMRKTGRYSSTWSAAARLTDAEGRYAIPDAQPGAWSIVVRPPEGSGLLSATRRSQKFKTGVSNVNMSLKKGASIEGKIVSLKGEPIARASIRLEGKGHQQDWFLGTTRQPLPRTNEKGAFRIGGLKPGTYTLNVSTIDPYYSAPKTKVSVSGSAAARVTIKAALTGSASGRVLSASGEPLSRARIYLHREGDPPNARPSYAYLDRDGRYRAGNLRPGIYTLRITSRTDRRKEKEWAVSPRTVVVSEGKLTAQDLTAN